jgi:hypothetical protein
MPGIRHSFWHAGTSSACCVHMIPCWASLCGGPFRKGIPEGHIARTAFPRDPILFSCRLPKMEALNHSFVCNRFGASDSSSTASLTSPGTSAGRIACTAFPRDLILFSCRLPKMEALNHSVVCTRFGASDSSRATFLTSPGTSLGPAAMSRQRPLFLRGGGRTENGGKEGK